MVQVLDSSSSDLKRWDGKAVLPTPQLRDVPAEQLELIRAKTTLDSTLWEASLKRFERDRER